MAARGPHFRVGGPAQSPGSQRQPVVEFASAAAHEVVGPIDQISSLVAIFVQRYRGKLDHDADILLSHIEAARDRLGITAAGLRKCFQVTMAQCEPVPVDMNAALNAALDSQARQIAESSATIRADKLPVLQGDRSLLTLLFENLVGNALKFHRPDTVPHVEVSAAQLPQAHVFEVSDNGIGIEPQYGRVVFEAFKRLNGRSYPGAGLGLTMAQAIVEAHGGNIWIEPSAEGARVKFELPVNS